MCLGTNIGDRKLNLQKACLGIESAMGRNRPYHYAPRTIDIDIIACENYNSDKDYLTVPHKLYKERAFVLIPLMDLYPDMDLYGDKFDISNLSNINDVVRKENI